MAGLEEVLAAELDAIGAQDIRPGTRSVQCSGDLRLLYRANLELRTALRILVPLRSFQVFDEKALHLQVGRIDWTAYMDADDTFAVDSTVFSTYFTHSQYVALKTKDAIVDQFRELTGRRPSVDTENPNIRINVHISDAQCTVSLDSSGESLHRRGYRQDGLIAPINEVLAAGMILLSGWTGDAPFLDPMCGSGTLPIEAALIATRTPPQLYREHFPFMRWPDFDPLIWAEVRANARAQIRPAPAPIFGFDKNFQAVQTAENHAKVFHLEKSIRFERRRFETLEPPAPNGILIVNPPYDARLTDINIEGFYMMIGNRLKHHFAGYQAWLITSNLDAIKHIGLHTSRRFTLYNGALECKYIKMDLYEGSRRPPREATEIAENATERPRTRKPFQPRPLEDQPRQARELPTNPPGDHENTADKPRSERKKWEPKDPNKPFAKKEFSRDDKPERKKWEPRDPNKPFAKKEFSRDDKPERKKWEPRDPNKPFAKKEFSRDDKPERKKWEPRDPNKPFAKKEFSRDDKPERKKWEPRDPNKPFAKKE